MSESITGTMEFDPELRYTPSGKALATFRLVLGDKSITRCEAWEPLSETIADRIDLYKRFAIVTCIGRTRERVYGGQTYKVFTIYAITYQGEEIPDLP
jgi:hypothetical protein